MKQGILVVAVAMVGFLLAPSSASAQSTMNQSSALFHNMYTGGSSMTTAGMYPAPYPTPRIAGHTFYTYQPLQPHQLMYAHQRSYYTPMPGAYYQNPCQGGNCGGYGFTGAYNHTQVRWQHGNSFAPPAQWRNPVEVLRGRLQNRSLGLGCQTCR